MSEHKRLQELERLTKSQGERIAELETRLKTLEANITAIGATPAVSPDYVPQFDRWPGVNSR